ncbi:MAG: hypothetical protein IJY92_00200 [Alphaproteobacteria bacterium]|nr:hypothetical protein [Alphaproteobacteria bacterium]
MQIQSKNSQNTLQALPALKKIYNSHSLQDYFRAELKNFNTQNHSFVETDILIETIFEETKRLYGETIGTAICDQLRTFPVMETGTHLAFLRDYDTPKKSDTRSLLNQNILISAALMKTVGQKYHIGFYGSNVSLVHPCGGGYFQLGDEIFPINTSNVIGKGVLYQSDKISPRFFNTQILSTAKLKMLQHVLDIAVQDENIPYRDKYLVTQKIVSQVLQGVTPQHVDTAYQNLKTTKKDLIQDAFSSLNYLAKEVYGYTFTDVDTQYNELKSIFEKEELTSLSDQVALVQTQTVNKALQNTGIKHITIDGTEISRQFLIKALKNKNSVWYKIFSNPDHFNTFQKELTGIRAAWKNEESPFVGVGKEKGVSKFFNIPLHALSHDPKTLIEYLEKKKIIPSSALICLICQTANVLAHGGFFQSTYSLKMKKAFEKVLNTINEPLRAKTLSKMPVDFMLLSLGAVVSKKTGKPLKLSEIARLSPKSRYEIIESIPKISGAKSVSNTLNILNQYLNETAPGYIEAEAARNRIQKPIIILKHNKIYRIYGYNLNTLLTGRGLC